MGTINEIEQDGTVYEIGSKAENVDYNGSMSGVDNVGDAIDALSHAVDDGGGVTPMDGYGSIGLKRPEQVKFIMDVLDKYLYGDSNYQWQTLNFIHVSDSHGAAIGGSYQLLDKVGADFLLHTGDMLSDDWDDDSTALYNLLTSTAKRCYVAIGNHDRVGQSSMNEVFYRFIAPLITRFGTGSTAQGLHEYTDDYVYNQSGVVTNKQTYYSFIKTIPCVPSVTIRCIVLNEYETASSSAYNPSLSMSSAQIVWFIAELQAAALAGQQVAIFTHQIISPISNIDIKWHDAPYKDMYHNGNFGADGTAIAKLVDAFMRNTTTENVTIGGQNYTYTKQGNASECPFVGWFVGHTHSDEQGWITAYPNQHVSVTTRAYGRSAVDFDQTMLETGFLDKWNYVRINPLSRVVTIYRVGNQQTYQGFKRDILIYKY